MARTDFRAASRAAAVGGHRAFARDRQPADAGQPDPLGRRAHRPCRPHRAEPRTAADGLRAGSARRARRVDPRAWRPPADPRPPARTEHLPDRRRRATLARVAAGRARDDPRADRGHRRRHGARDRDHREPPARGPDAARRSRDVRPDGPRAWLQHPQAGRQAGQGQGLPREPAAAGRCAAGDPRAGVFAQGQPVPRLRADEGRGPEEAPSPGRTGRARRADPDQAPRQDRGPAGPEPGRRRPDDRWRRARRTGRARPASTRTDARRAVDRRRGSRTGGDDSTTRWSTPSRAWSTPSTSSSGSWATPRSAARSARPTGPTWRST